MSEIDEVTTTEADDEKPKALPHIYSINGKDVVFKERYPLNENRGLMKAFSEADQAKPETYIRFMTQMIVEWGFEGDPKDPKSYDTMDAPSELYPLMMATLRYWNQRFNVAPKN
jgi:hypothetical protein